MTAQSEVLQANHKYRQFLDSYKVQKENWLHQCVTEFGITPDDLHQGKYTLVESTTTPFSTAMVKMVNPEQQEVISVFSYAPALKDVLRR